MNPVIARVARTLAAAALPAGVLGCAGNGAPVRTFASVAGEYVLVERDGQPLPQTLSLQIDGRSCTSTLIRLVMTLREDGTWMQEDEEREQCPGAPPRTIQSAPFSDTYQLRGPRGDTLLLGADTVEVEGYPNPWGVFDGDEIRLVMPMPLHNDTMYFRYVRQRPRK